MKRLLTKKTVLIYALTVLLLLSLSLFALGISATENVYAISNDVLLDADGLQFEGVTSSILKVDEYNYFGSGTDNWILETQVNKTSPSVKVVAGGYPDRISGGNNDAVRVEIRLLFNRHSILVSEDATFMALKVYNSDDIAFENPIASAESYVNNDNFIRTLRVSPDKICNEDGELSSFVVRVYSDATSWASSVIIDCVKIVFSTGDIGGSAVLFAGDCVTVANPENVSDNNVVWMTAEGYSHNYIDLWSYGGLYAYVDDPAVVAMHKAKVPTVECITESDGTETLLLKNAVFALNVGELTADDYEQFVMDILLSDKRAKGNHTLYLYGSNPERFVDSNGNPVGYAAKIMVKSYEQGFHNRFILEGKDEVAKLAGNDGLISNIYVLYHGNTLDTAEETVGLREGSQIWINKIQFLKEDDVETPVMESEYDKYDISDIFPVGQSVNIKNKALAAGGVVSNAILSDKRVSELSFVLKMASGDNLCLLFNATGLKKVNEYLDGGILFYLSDGKVGISASKNGEEAKSLSVVPTIGTFSVDTTVKIGCIPYYLNAVEAGFCCEIWIDGVEIVSGYFNNDYLSLGSALHLCYEAKSTDFSVKVGSAKTEGVKSGAELMQVKLNSAEILYSLDKTDIPLVLSWYNTGFDTIAALKCDSDVASVNQDSKRVVFSDNGEANVSYSITNAFGTFKSNNLSLTCEDVIDLQNNDWFYGSALFIALCIMPIAVCGAVIAILSIKKSKSAKSGK